MIKAPLRCAPAPFVPAAKQNYVEAVRFTDQKGFRRTVNERVHAFIAARGIKTRSLPAMYVKTAIVSVWWALSYALWIYSGIADWHGAVAYAGAISFGLAVVAVGFAVMHDANHGGYSNNGTVNRIMSYSGEVIGLSTFIWRQQHNIWHHTYTNIAGLDEALEADGWLRSSPKDVWKPLHRYQHFYAPIVYAMAGIGLMLIRNFTVYFTGKSSEHFIYRKMTREEKLTFWAGRLFNITIYLVIPFLVFPWWLALTSFLLFSFTAGTVMAHVLMIAHVSRDVEFVEPQGNPLHVENEWAIHQVVTTMNFCPRNPLVNWYVGGLNWQIEHHLFPQFCHLVYPQIAPIVQETCREFGIPYLSNPSLISSTVNHYKSLKTFGQRPLPA